MYFASPLGDIAFVNDEQESSYISNGYVKIKDEDIQHLIDRGVDFQSIKADLTGINGLPYELYTIKPRINGFFLSQLDEPYLELINQLEADGIRTSDEFLKIYDLSKYGDDLDEFRKLVSELHTNSIKGI